MNRRALLLAAALWITVAAAYGQQISTAPDQDAGASAAGSSEETSRPTTVETGSATQPAQAQTGMTPGMGAGMMRHGGRGMMGGGHGGMMGMGHGRHGAMMGASEDADTGLGMMGGGHGAMMGKGHGGGMKGGRQGGDHGMDGFHGKVLERLERIERRQVLIQNMLEQLLLGP